MNGVDVTVNHPPASGSYVGNNKLRGSFRFATASYVVHKDVRCIVCDCEGKGSRRADGCRRLCVCAEPRHEQFEQWHICKRDNEFDIRLRGIQQRELSHRRGRMYRFADRKLLRHLFEFKFVRP